VKEPLVIPVLLGLVAADGTPLAAEGPGIGPDGLYVFDQAAATVTFTGVAKPPAPSLFRGFSAPVKLSLDLTDDEWLALLRHDADPFNRWQAAQTVAMRLLVRLSTGSNIDPAEGDGLASALLAFLETDAERDPAFAALVLTLPSEADVAQEIAADVDPDAIHRARRALRRRIGERCADRLEALREALRQERGYSPDAESAGRRSLRNVALDLIAAADAETGERLAAEQLAGATNMTDRLAALGTLTTLPGDAREAALGAFAEGYAAEPLVLDKWFTLQAAIPEETTLERVRGLMSHPAFALTNPNRVRALVGSFAMLNPTQFHHASGSGYAFLAGQIVGIDDANPQLASRLATAFGNWRMMDRPRREQAEAALRSIAQKPKLSRDVADIVQRALAE
jgi:aminopeptidase N